MCKNGTPSPPSSHWQPRIRLDLFHHRIGSRLAHAGDDPQGISEEAAIGGHVGDAYLEEVVKAARHHMAFDNVWRAAHRVGEAVENVGCRLVQQYLDIDEEGAVEFCGVEPRAEAGDVALTRQPLDPFGGGGRISVFIINDSNVMNLCSLILIYKDQTYS